MSKPKNTSDLPVMSELSETTKREMEAGRKAALENGAAQARAETSRAQEAAAILAKDAEEKRQQAEDKLRVVTEAEAAHAAKVSVTPPSSV